MDHGEKALLQDIGHEDLTQLLHLINSTNPYVVQMVGLIKVIRSELAASFAKLELEDTGLGAAGAVADVLKIIRKSKDNDDEHGVDLE
ncbi:hypothetical protein K432DRAFT_406379 [Lepidopterella palustris CBS 459.81]|uniref:Uncharacterized protein n=1 Tax=Lepidopterella palustris CBS 459.81 TaxID=1314670 RepID=A0A8E2E6Y2_9PEZI|nr:hypothetical protein K432DRAFT_406379 [Lepidopterella palustris CBS 459.81]